MKRANLGILFVILNVAAAPKNEANIVDSAARDLDAQPTKWVDPACPLR
ncbi:MAG: hypothetical protein Q8P51_04020 [Ignavibacteria bacterium]|nr:hypothetical protein [Ignavibacteria bacterium]